MSTETNKLLVRRYYEEIVNTGNVDAIEDFVSSDYTAIHDGVQHPVGIEGAKLHILGVRTTYANLHLTIEQQVAEGDVVVTQVTMHGTHSGEWLGIKPTGKRIAVSAVNIDRIENGRIVEHTGSANLLHPLMNVGAIAAVQGEGEDTGHADAQRSASSRQLAGLIGPTLVAVVVSESWLVQPRLFDLLTPPIVYLSGLLMFVAGLAILQKHNKWEPNWTILVTLSGLFAALLGLLRMFTATFYQRVADGNAIGVAIIEGVLFIFGLALTFTAYRRQLTDVVAKAITANSRPRR